MARMTLLLAAAAVLIGSAVALSAPAGYRATPAGFVRSECVHSVPSGSHLQERPDHLHVTLPTGEERRLPLCDRSDGRPAFLSDAEAARLTGEAVPASAGGPLPPDYDGWLEYTAFKDSSAHGFDTFLGDFSVPDAPAADPQILYLFTGLQNIDWIPKVDPEPSTPFDIIQPVLQYPGDFGNYWSVKSWYVTLNAGAVESNEVQVNQGDAIFGNMTRSGPQSWFVGSTSVATGKSTTITATHPRLATQPWAYTTLECYGCQDCSTYPTQPSKFTKMSITQGGKPVAVEWEANPKPAQDRKCHESIQIISGAEVTIGFQ